MNTTLRASIVALGLFAGGTLAGPAISAASDEPSTASGTLAEAAPASLFVPIVAYRALDTRLGDKLDVDGDPFTENSPIVRFFADLEVGSDIFVRIPAEAVAVSYNITVAQTEGVGFLKVSPANANSGGETSNINWTADGQQAANSGNVLLGTANDGEGNGSDSLDVTIGGESGAKTHVVIDITGYYIPAT